MIKLDIVNAVVAKTGVSRTKAEEAVETVFKAMKNALGKGERIELRRFGVFNVRPQNRHRAQSAHRPGSQHPSRQGGALQTRQGIAIALRLRSPCAFDLGHSPARKLA